VQLPVLADAGVRNVIGGSYDAASHTVTMFPQGHQVLIRLGKSARPTAGLQVTGTAPGQHTLTTLTSGVQTSASATITNTGMSTMHSVTVSLRAPSGWTSQPTSPASFAAIKPGQAKTVTWSVTPPASALGGTGVVVSAAYRAPDGASGSVSAEQWVSVQPPLPLPTGATDLALTAGPLGFLHLAVGTRDRDQRRRLPDVLERQPGHPLGLLAGDRDAVDRAGLEPAGHHQRQLGLLPRRRRRRPAARLVGGPVLDRQHMGGRAEPEHLPGRGQYLQMPCPSTR
jgi:NPCBM-associated, NEW3 domain of alpha-galactosidase